MKLKSLLIGSAASIVAITGAQAADLPTAEPVEYVQICDAYGAGYFFIPGGDTCLRINGYVQLDAAWVNQDGVYDANFPGDGENEFGTRTRAQLQFDARTSTGLGVLRSFIALRGNISTLPERPTGTGGQGVFTAADNVVLQEAFLSLEAGFGTIVAGHTASVFDIFGSNVADILGFIDDPTGENNHISYQANFGSFSAFISVEDTFSGAHGRVENVANENFDVGGTDFPDLVGALRFGQGWGFVQASGAVGQVSDAFAGEELGWAAAIGGELTFGMITAGLQATYADGLVGYASAGAGGGFTEFSDGDVDAGGLDTNTAWSVRGGLSAGVTDAIALAATAYYTDYTDDDGPQDGNSWGITGDVRYVVVPGLSLTGEVGYENVENDTGPDGDRWGVAGRIRRDF